MTDVLIAQLPEAGEYVQGWLGAAIGIGGSIVSGIFGSSRAKKQARAAAREKRRLSRELENLEANRQPVINPYEDVQSVAGLAQDLSGNMTNPMANLGVATQAAEMQAEEADMALANTLDTIRATGSGAGGATALAQAALQSKKGVSASIEAQEVNNEKLRAQGQQDLERRKMAEQQRIQGIEMSEAQRLQQADVSGKQFVYGQTEQRELTALERKQTELEGAQAREMAANQARTQAITGMIGGIAGGVSGLANSGAFGSKVMGKTYKEQVEYEKNRPTPKEKSRPTPKSS